MSNSTHAVDEIKNWSVVRRKIRAAYEQITEEELQDVQGDSRRLVSLIHQKAGGSISEIEHKIDEIAAASGGLLDRLSSKFRDAADSTQDHLSSGAKSLKSTVGDLAKTSNQSLHDSYDSARQYGSDGLSAVSQGLHSGYDSTIETIQYRPGQSVAVAFGFGAAIGFTLIKSLLTPPPPPTIQRRVSDWWQG